MINNFVNPNNIAAWNKSQCQEHAGVYINCGLQPNRWYVLDCVNFPHEGVQECSGSCMPLNYGSFTACRPSNMEYDGAPAGIVYHIITPIAPSNPTNQLNKNMLLYGIMGLILLIGITMVSLI